MQAVDVLEDVLLWDAPDICFPRRDHLRLALYIFKVWWAPGSAGSNYLL